MKKSRYSQPQEKLQYLLRKARLSAGLRQTDLAKSLKRPQSFVSKYESGERTLDVLELKQICQALEISLTTFIKQLEKK